MQRKVQKTPERRFLTIHEFKEEKPSAQVSLSLDVIYHLVNDTDYNEYMENLFDSAKEYCIIYSANHEESTPDKHVRKRKFTSWISNNRPEWILTEYIPNKYKYEPGLDPNETSFADFFIFKKQQ